MDTIAILERWFKEDDCVYRLWSFDGGKTWKKEPTPLTDIPVLFLPR